MEETGSIIDDEVLVHPNPVEGSINIKTSGFKDGRLKIMDMSGREVISGTVKDEAIDASSMPSGLYILHVSKENRSATKKFIKK